MISKLKKNNTNDNDTESDSDFEILAKSCEQNKVFEDLDKINQVQNFIYNNNIEYQKLKENNSKGTILTKPHKSKKHARPRNNNSLGESEGESDEVGNKKKKI